jgi:transcriptional regulator with XRE-family HTH domain
MAKNFKVLLETMPEERRKHIEALTQGHLDEINNLKDLRQAFELTQMQVAESLNINQAAVSKIENESDMLIRTLRRFLKAIGANLKIVAAFPNRDIVINQFNELSEQENTSTPSPP